MGLTGWRMRPAGRPPQGATKPPARLRGAHLALAAALLLAACARALPPASDAPPAEPARLPPMKSFEAAPAPATGRSNASIAREFMALAFELESGRRLPVLSRFEGPVTVRLAGGPVPEVTERDLDALLRRLRSEAGIAISRAPSGAPASITIELVNPRALRRVVPRAACFVSPGVSGWAEFRRLRNSPATDWARLRTRERMAIFLPAGAAPQELRDCLHEELAQALGPVNDLYRLNDSIFNDDNFNSVLTGFDMTVLRAFYDPALQSGMTPAQVAARLPAILARINPGGASGHGSPPVPTPRAWVRAIEAALGPGTGGEARLAAAARAVAIARASGMNDHRLGFSLYARGRLALGRDSKLARASFAEALRIFESDANTRIHAAHVAVQMAAQALSAGAPGRAIALADRYARVALEAQNARLLASLLMIKSQALEVLGRDEEARVVRLDSLGWARYGFGAEAEVRRREREIAALAPRQKRMSAR